MTDPASPASPVEPADSAPQPQPPTTTPAPETAAPGSGPRAWGGVLLLNLVSFAVVALPAAWYFKLGLQLRGERTVALMAAIPWPFYLLALLASLGLALFAALQAVRGQPLSSPRFRLLPIAAVLFLSIELFAVSPATFPFPPDAVIAIEMRAFENGLTTEDGLLPPDPALFAKLLPEQSPPFLRDGKRMPAWNLVVRTGCDGPIAELPAGVEAGTLLICLAPDRRSGWATAVGMGSAYAGPAQLVRESGETRPLVVLLQGVSPEEASDEAIDAANDVPAGAVIEDATAFPDEP